MRRLGNALLGPGLQFCPENTAIVKLATRHALTGGSRVLVLTLLATSAPQFAIDNLVLALRTVDTMILTGQTHSCIPESTLGTQNAFDHAVQVRELTGWAIPAC